MLHLLQPYLTQLQPFSTVSFLSTPPPHQRFIQYLASRNTLFNLNNFLDKGALQGGQIEI